MIVNPNGDGKGPGFALLWGLVALLFVGMVTAAGVLGYVPWWAAAGVDVAISGGLAWLMLTAQWD